MQLGIAGKTGLLLGVVALATGALVVAVLYRGCERLLVENELSQLRAQAQLRGERLRAKVHDLEQDARFLAALPPLRGIARATTAHGTDPLDGSSVEAWRDRLAVIFESLLLTRPSYLQVRYIGAADGGRELLRFERDAAGQVVRVPGAGLQQKGGRPYVRRALRLNPGEVYLSPIELNREHGRIVEPPVAVLRAAAPIHDAAGEAFGVVVINARWNELLDSPTDRPSEVFVTNGEGDYLLHPDPTRAFAFERGGRERIQDDYPVAAPLFTPEFAPLQVESDPHDDYVLTLSRVAISPSDPGRHLTVGLGVSRDELLAQARDLRATTIFLTLLLVGLTTPLAVVFGRQLARPLQRAVGIADRIGAGDLDQELELDQGGEAGLLLAALKRMVTSLSQARERARDQEEQRELLLDELAEIVAELSTTSTRLRDASGNTLAKAQEHAAAVSLTVSTVDETSTSAERVADVARAVADSSSRSARAGRQGRESVEATLQHIVHVQETTGSVANGIVALAEQVQAVGGVVTTVADVADQTNLLAFNAALEASRAGEHGASFGVVADQIRELAEQARLATIEVRSILGDILRATRKAVRSMREGSRSVDDALDVAQATDHALRTLTEEIDASTRYGSQIAAAANQQVAGTQHILESMRNVDAFTRESLSAARHAQEAAEALDELAKRLDGALAERNADCV